MLLFDFQCLSLKRKGKAFAIRARSTETPCILCTALMRISCASYAHKMRIRLMLRLIMTRLKLRRASQVKDVYNRAANDARQ
jgi:hypothetical protein